jgi:hypothetical protein
MNIKLDPNLATETKALVALAFRNGPIEGIHAGRPCPVCSGNPEASHISDEEMKTIMKSARRYPLPAAVAAGLRSCRLQRKSGAWTTIYPALG